ncbi:MAG: hypothetical protein ACJAT2_003205 [Bacteriovoracaceae bacterium]|jgi:hypothetical protein
MKNMLILLSLLIFANNASARTNKFYFRYKGQSDAEALDKVDEALTGLKNGKGVYQYQRVRNIYSQRGCNVTRAKYVDLKAVTVKKAYRVNRYGELETFQQATVKIAHKRCSK